MAFLGKLVGAGLLLLAAFGVAVVFAEHQACRDLRLELAKAQEADNVPRQRVRSPGGLEAFGIELNRAPDRRVLIEAEMRGNMFCSK